MAEGVGRGFGHGEAEAAAVATQELHRGLDGDGVGLDEQGAGDGDELAMNSQGAGVVAFGVGGAEAGDLARQEVADDADDADGADGHEGEGHGVVAAEDGEAGAAECDLAGGVGGAGGFFDGADVGMRAEAGDGGGGEGDAGAPGDVVEHDGDGGGVGDVHEVLIEAVLHGLVVVGIDAEGGIGAGVVRELLELHGVVGAVAAGADDGDEPAGVGEGDAGGDELAELALGEGGRFAGGAVDDDAFDAAVGVFALGLEVDLVFEACEVDGGGVGGEGGDDGGEGAGEARVNVRGGDGGDGRGRGHGESLGREVEGGMLGG